MPRDPRTYITVHDGMPDHPKIEELSDGGFRLLMTMWCWCSRNKTDGRIPLASWTKRGTPRTRREVIAAGLFHERDGAVWVHDYLEHQRSAAEIDALAEKRRAAGSKGGKAKAEAVANAVASASHVAKQTASKSVAESETDTEEEKNLLSEPSRLDVESVCTHLADKIASNGSKRPTITAAWRTSARLMIDLDKRTPEQIHKAIDWCQSDEFWRANILSVPKLREKFDQLRLAAQRPVNGRPPEGHRIQDTFAALSRPRSQS
jgi:uncharacterized protein YdaU (DUF1376 family)